MPENNVSVDAFSKMQTGDPVAIYKKAILGKVEVSVVNPFNGVPENLILVGNPTKNNVNCFVEVWSQMEEVYFDRQNKPLFKAGYIVKLKDKVKPKEKGKIEKSYEEYTREKIEELENNPCPLINGNSQRFEDLNLATLPGQPKIWTKDKILIKTGQEEWIFGWNGEGVGEKSSQQINSNEVFQSLVIAKNITDVIDQIYYTSIDSIDVSLSGAYMHFNNAINFKVKIESEVFQGTKLTLIKVLSLALIDAINPCALAVLSLMLITILTYNPQKKRNVLLAGLAFVISVFIMYLFYGLVIIRSFQIIQALTSIRIWLYQALGAGAIILGVLKLRDFFRAQAVCNTVPKVNKIISKVTSPIGAFVVGAFVTVFLLPCTIGPYIICGGILCSLDILKAFPLLLLYNFVFVLPMLIMVLIIYFGLSKIKDISSWQARNIKYLDLISGLIIVILGLAMVFSLI